MENRRTACQQAVGTRISLFRLPIFAPALGQPETPFSFRRSFPHPKTENRLFRLPLPCLLATGNAVALLFACFWLPILRNI
ncbi:MAG: hypothetical protein D8B42_07565 [Kingella sp. (in: b-proteobacteria)]|nr:MAG: hypothetical protein D8B42_07565 [Kingella sp. (in: b-proteobacteria)]